MNAFGAASQGTAPSVCFRRGNYQLLSANSFRGLTPSGGKLGAWLNRCGVENCHATPIIPQ